MAVSGVKLFAESGAERGLFKKNLSVSEGLKKRSELRNG